MRGAIIFTIVSLCIVHAGFGKEPNRYIYQLKIYHLANQEQLQRLDNFFEHAYIPALHRAGISAVGVFKPIVQDSSKLQVFVFIPFKSAEQMLELNLTLQNDKEYQRNGSAYLNALHSDPPYRRLESILLRAFTGMPKPTIPPLTSEKLKRIYELRSYESATESIGSNKIHMFNNGEIDLFKRLDFNAIFYGEVISGNRMPNLMYMTSFNNKEERDEHWKNFGSHPEWKRMSSMAEYQHNVSKINVTFLHPAMYSDF